LLSPSAAYAWGHEGHEIVALIAANEMTPKAKAAVQGLLGGPDAATAMEQYSTWADEIRPERRETAPWHFVDIEISSGGYDAARDCAHNDCVVAQIERDTSVIGDKSLAMPVRAEALRFLIHFVGDETQPLHCSDNHDRGGNEVSVILNGDSTNLHAVWDTAVVEALGNDPSAIAARLSATITPAEQAAWTKGTPASWSNECWNIAKREVYADFHRNGGTFAPIVLPPDYAAKKSSIAAEQLKRAGVRLATILNATFKGEGQMGIVRSTSCALLVVATVGCSRPASQGTISPEQASSHEGTSATVEGTVSDVHTARSGRVTFIDMGGSYPNNAFTGVVFASDMATVGDLSDLTGKTVDISGEVKEYRGKPEIIISSRSQIKMR
jgi:hypothetical protein